MSLVLSMRTNSFRLSRFLYRGVQNIFLFVPDDLEAEPANGLPRVVQCKPGPGLREFLQERVVQSLPFKSGNRRNGN